MDKKRWAALGVAGAILLFSVITQITTSIVSVSQSDDESGFLSGLMESDSGLTENIIEFGDFNNRIAVLYVNGAIVDSGSSSLLDTGTYNHQDFLAALKLIEEDESVKGIVLAVDSPGGGVFESAQIKSRLDALQQDLALPIYAVFGSTAASGGYYISAGADKIFASKETLTGSIGVIMQAYNISGLMETLGISDETIKSGDYKDIGSATREMTDTERQIFQDMIDNSYDDFVSIISAGRDMSEAEVRKIADGRIYDGRQAKEVGLVDEFGYLEEVIEAMKEDYNLTDAMVFSYETSSGFGSLFFSQVQGMFKSSTLTSAELERMLGSNRSPRLMYLYGE